MSGTHTAYRGTREWGVAVELSVLQRSAVQSSPVFAAMLEGEWREARERRVELEPGTKITPGINGISSRSWYKLYGFPFDSAQCPVACCYRNAV
eukprot:3941322-Rhodomonas_salina.4